MFILYGKKKLFRKRKRHRFSLKRWIKKRKVVRLENKLQVVNDRLCEAEQRTKYWESLIDYYENNY